MAKSKKNWWLIGLILLIVILTALAIYRAKTKPKGTAVTVEESAKRTIKETVSASGKVYPIAQVKISSDVSGEIVELYVEEGDSVVIGQLLAKINPDVYVSAVERGQAGLNATRSQYSISKAQLESSKSQKEQILAQLENAKIIHDRNIQLKKDGVISQAEFDQSAATLRGLEANLKAAAANIRSAEKSMEAAGFTEKGSAAGLKELKTNLDRTIIRAPRSGIVSSLSVEKGERVVGTIQMTGTEMMRISDLNAMEVQVEVSENDILKVKVGDEADIEVDAYTRKKFKGEVTHISNSASNIKSALGTASLTTDQVTNFQVKIRIIEDSYKDLKSSVNKHVFRPGMSASVDIYTRKEENVITVPIQSVAIREKKDAKIKKDVKTEIQEDQYNQVVFIMDADTAKMVIVTTGIQDNEFIHVISGVKSGDKIVSGPYSELSKGLKNGDKIHIKKEEKEKKEPKE
ncbi:MAG: efflux RND transporter periplasmic adaptor subunit [Saprospiraceae bacterium]|nr:efflux RND transporter periplasmic adaptor subunit [Saprospiraceae bacterium]MBP6695144.1 efflux RND transporter periplasmic adaptor subunit [Saprospiraceae bacterium]